MCSRTPSPEGLPSAEDGRLAGRPAGLLHAAALAEGDANVVRVRKRPRRTAFQRERDRQLSFGRVERVRVRTSVGVVLRWAIENSPGASTAIAVAPRAHLQVVNNALVGPGNWLLCPPEGIQVRLTCGMLGNFGVGALGLARNRCAPTSRKTPA